MKYILIKRQPGSQHSFTTTVDKTELAEHLDATFKHTSIEVIAIVMVEDQPVPPVFHAIHEQAGPVGCLRTHKRAVV
jgi:hypothetical protein